MIFAILTATGFFVGLLSSFFGIGGGLIVIPALYDITPQTVVGSSLTMIFFNSLVNTLTFVRSGKIPDRKLILTISGAMLVGSIQGGTLINFLSPQNIKLLFALLVLFSIIKALLRKNGDNSEDESFISNLTTKSIIRITIVAYLAGLLSGITGLGGGIILIPFFMAFFRMPYRWIPVYTNVAMAVSCFAATITYSLGPDVENNFTNPILERFQFGQINIPIVCGLFVGSTLASRHGANFGNKISKKTTEYLFLGLLIFIFIKIIISTL